MKPLSPEARRLFELARGQDEPDTLAQGRVGRALAARIAADATAGLAASSALTAKSLASVAAKPLLAATVTKSVLALVAGALVGTGWLALHPGQPPLRSDQPDVSRARARPAAAPSLAERRVAPSAAELPAASPPPPSSRPSSPPQRATAKLRPTAATAQPLPMRTPAPVTVQEMPGPAGAARPPEPVPNATPGATAAPPRSDESPFPVAPASPAVTAPLDHPSPDPLAHPASASPRLGTDVRQVVNPLQAETEALRSAQQALRDGKPRLALELLDQQDGRFRTGVLQQERAAARVLALCQAGRAAEAKAEAERFERVWPRSPLKARVRSACWGR